MNLFKRRKPPSTSGLGGAADAPADDPEIPRYPPFLKGLPVAAPARVVATQAELIARLQDGLAFTDARFASLVRPVVERYAAFVHLLPASEAHHHRGAGGLFRHGLEVAFHAAQASQGRIFALDRGPAERRELEPRWRLAAGLAGLCHDVGKPVSDLSVSDRDGRTTWRPLLESLADWAAANGVEHYFLRWRERRHARHETFGLLVLERILTPEVTAWLVDADPEIMRGLLSAVAGIDDGAALGTLVVEADRASVERDLRENHIDPATTSLGVPVDRYENPWRPNYEAGAVGMWLAVGATAWVTADWWDLHAAPFRYLAVTALVMAVLWLPGTLRVWRRHHRLRGKPLAFIAPPELERQVGNGEDLWLGWGFDWAGEHAQLVHDLLRVGPSRVIPSKSARLGADWIHGLGARERAVRLPLVHTEGHLLVVGTTGAGKSRLFDLLVTQAVLRGEAVVITDFHGTN